MPIIIQKDNAPCLFKQSDGRIVRLEPYPIMNKLSEEAFEALMKEYGGFIKPRILSDENPKGCFIIQGNEESAKSQEKEAGKDFHEEVKTADELMTEAKEEVEKQILEEKIEEKEEEKIVVSEEDKVEEVPLDEGFPVDNIADESEPTEEIKTPVEKKKRGRKSKKG